MRLVQTRNKRLVFGILFSALIVGIMLTIGQVCQTPNACCVSAPVSLRMPSSERLIRKRTGNV